NAIPRIARQVSLAIFGTAAFVYMLKHPWDFPHRYFPTTAFCEFANSVIPEDDAVLISNIHAGFVEEFIVRNTHRSYVPLHRHIVDQCAFAQWKKPPHPEWIPDVAQGGYPRMFENGAVWIYPYTAQDNPEMIDEWLNQRRPVYFLTLQLFTVQDAEICQSLANRYRFEVWYQNYPPLSRTPPKYLLDQVRGYSPVIARLLPRPAPNFVITPD